MIIIFRRGRKHSLLVYDDDNEINFSELSLASSTTTTTTSANNKEQQSSEALLTKLEERETEQINNNLPVESNNRTQVTEETIQVTHFAEQKSDSPKV